MYLYMYIFVDNMYVICTYMYIKTGCNSCLSDFCLTNVDIAIQINSCNI